MSTRTEPHRIPAAFEPGDLPPYFDDLILPQPDLLGGTWKEEDKPFAKCCAFFERLGFSSVKRKVAARSHCNMEIALSQELNRHLLQKTESGNCVMKSSESSTAATTPSTSSPPSQPLSPSGQSIETHPHSENYTWSIRQFFALGKAKSIEIMSNGLPIEVNDSDTGTWTVSSVYCDGKLIQRRYSEALGLTMYDTRCVVERKVPLYEEGIHHQESWSELDTGKNESKPGHQWQLFQGKIVDHRDTDAVATCMYYLRKVS